MSDEAAYARWFEARADPSTRGFALVLFWATDSIDYEQLATLIGAFEARYFRRGLFVLMCSEITIRNVVERLNGIAPADASAPWEPTDDVGPGDVPDDQDGDAWDAIVASCAATRCDDCGANATITHRFLRQNTDGDRIAGELCLCPPCCRARCTSDLVRHGSR